jgi:hypothetical protein
LNSTTNSLGAETRASKMLALQFVTKNIFGNLLRCEWSETPGGAALSNETSRERRPKILGENAAFCQFL